RLSIVGSGARATRTSWDSGASTGGSRQMVALRRAPTPLAAENSRRSQWVMRSLCPTLQEMRLQFLQSCPTDQVELDHFPHSFGRLAAGPQHHEQAGDQGYVALDRHAIGTLEK